MLDFWFSSLPSKLKQKMVKYFRLWEIILEYMKADSLFVISPIRLCHHGVGGVDGSRGGGWGHTPVVCQCSGWGWMMCGLPSWCFVVCCWGSPVSRCTVNCLNPGSEVSLIKAQYLTSLIQDVVCGGPANNTSTAQCSMMFHTQRSHHNTVGAIASVIYRTFLLYMVCCSSFPHSWEVHFPFSVLPAECLAAEWLSLDSCRRSRRQRRIFETVYTLTCWELGHTQSKSIKWQFVSSKSTQLLLQNYRMHH